MWRIVKNGIKLEFVFINAFINFHLFPSIYHYKILSPFIFLKTFIPQSQLSIYTTFIIPSDPNPYNTFENINLYKSQTYEHSRTNPSLTSRTQAISLSRHRHWSCLHSVHVQFHHHSLPQFCRYLSICTRNVENLLRNRSGIHNSWCIW